MFAAVFPRCQNTEYENLNIIRLFQDESRRFVYTNKRSGYFLGNSHRQNSKENEGWCVNRSYYLKDYRLYLGSNPVPRDSIHEFIYGPATTVRKYSDQLIETFTMLDSIDALVWEFELSGGNEPLYFEPLLHIDAANKSHRLSATNQHIIFSPRQIWGKFGQGDSLWMGLNLVQENVKKTVVVAVLEKNATSLRKLMSDVLQQYKAYKIRRSERLMQIVSQNQVLANIPEISVAVTWAQISLDALVTYWAKPGIWGGIPHEDIYKGRETFISLFAALIASGQYQDVRRILSEYAELQLRDDKDPWFGRIPNFKSDEGLSYNTADVTWWYIRSVYEYYQCSGDFEFIQELFPVIKRAIIGALRYRVDKNFFLIHADQETWMTAIPRGDRAVEIQALWYTALLIGSKIARMDGENNLSEYWLAIANTLKQSFNNQFWNSFSYQMYDHIKQDGTRDKKIRPNPIFAITVPDLPGIEPLISHPVQGRVAERIVRTLTYYYGVSSLFQDDKEFHPWLKDAPGGIQYNGLVWPWLAGPVISSLLKMNHEQLAYQLYYFEAKQILEWDAIGSQGNVLEARPSKMNAEPRLGAPFSQAWSLATFINNFYQDFIGYRPNAIDSTLIFMPNFPRELTSVSATLHFKNHIVHFQYHHDIEDGIFSFDISFDNLDYPLKVFFDFPGFDAIQFTLDKDLISHSFELFEAERRSYQAYPALDWHFALPRIFGN
jgi:glycogen debranching enzyme